MFCLVDEKLGIRHCFAFHFRYFFGVHQREFEMASEDLEFCLCFVRIVDIYWKNEHRLMCTSEICTAAERDRYEKSV